MRLSRQYLSLFRSLTEVLMRSLQPDRNRFLVEVADMKIFLLDSPQQNCPYIDDNRSYSYVSEL